MLCFKWGVCIFVALLSFSSLATAIVVDLSGKGNFRSIQAAIDSVPDNNKNWVTIDIRPGRYTEKVWIHFNKPFIYLRGAGMNKTYIIWNDHEPINEGATFTSEAANVLAKDITFINPFKRTTRMEKGVAARISGDKSAFYHCAFMGLQDTLWDDGGRHYFRDCAIAGGVDFIFGAGQSHYERCTIALQELVVAQVGVGYITAHGRSSPKESSGFVFKTCNIAGNGRAFLGRPWRDYARVLFYSTVMNNGVDPKGWALSEERGKAGTTSLSEYNCSGPGANTAFRTPWEKKLSVGEVNQLVSLSYIDNDGWVEKALQRFNH